MSKYRLLQVDNKNALYSIERDSVIKGLDMNFLGDRLYLSRIIHGYNNHRSNNYEVQELGKLVKTIHQSEKNPRTKLTMLTERELVDLAYGLAEKIRGKFKDENNQEKKEYNDFFAAKIFHELDYLQKEEEKLIKSGKIETTCLSEEEAENLGVNSAFVADFA